jgi:HlyD family secretion protein
MKSFVEERTSRRKLILLAGIAAIIVLGAAAFVFTREKPKKLPSDATVATAETTSGKKENAPKISVMIPGRIAVSKEVSITGTLSARNEMPVGIEGEGGRISQIYVDAGDSVGAGQIMARINTDLLKPQVAQLSASLDEAQAQADLDQANYDRARSVADTGAISRQELDRARASAATAKARVNVVSAQLKEARARLARSDVRAPAAGIVLERKAEIGQTVNGGGDWMFRLARNGQVELKGQIAEQDLPKVRVGQIVLVRLSGVEQSFQGRIWQLGAIIDPRTRQGTARIELVSSPLLRPGAFAQATISAGGEIAPVLPQSAIQTDAQGTYVLVVNNSNKVERRGVKVSGAAATGVMISAGLTGQEKIVTTAGAFLQPGELVDPQIIQGTK